MATKATHTHFTSDKKKGTHTQTLLHSKAGVAGRIGLRYGVGVAGRSLSGAARGQRALLEEDDAVGDVRGVRVDRRHADRREVV